MWISRKRYDDLMEDRRQNDRYYWKVRDLTDENTELKRKFGILYETLTREQLLSLEELRTLKRIAYDYGIQYKSGMTKSDIIKSIVAEETELIKPFERRCLDE